MRADKLFISAAQLAAQTGLPEEWLKAEADAGRIPSLRVGRRLLFNPAKVEESLLARTADAVPTPAREAAHA